jgi:hypothetical protein
MEIYCFSKKHTNKPTAHITNTGTWPSDELLRYLKLHEEREFPCTDQEMSASQGRVSIMEFVN